MSKSAQPTFAPLTNPYPRWLPISHLLRATGESPQSPYPLRQSGIWPWIMDHGWHRKPFERQGELPVWRVVVAAQLSTFISSKGGQAIRFTVSVFHHHAIGDGLSSGAFHLTLLDALNIILADTSTINPSPLVRIPLLPLLPTIEMGTPLPVSFFFALKKIFQAYIYNPIDAGESSGPLISASTPRPPISNLNTLSLTSQVVSIVICWLEIY